MRKKKINDSNAKISKKIQNKKNKKIKKKNEKMKKKIKNGD